jgi:hypothetical protein
MTLYKRLTLVAEHRRIVKVFYPVFPPDQNAAEVAAWLADRPRAVIQHASRHRSQGALTALADRLPSTARASRARS